MKSPFNVKEKAEEYGGQLDLMNEVWNTLMEKESDSLDDFFDCQVADDNYKILSDLKKSRCKEKVKKDSKNRSNDVVKSSINKHKLLKGGTCLPVKKLLAKELNRTNKSKPINIPKISKDESSFLSHVMLEDSFQKEDKKPLLMSSSPEPVKEPVKKPCAAVVGAQLHFKTVDYDYSFHCFQQELNILYNSAQNIRDTDPVPYPSSVVVSPPINGYDRCPCSFCKESFFRLKDNYQVLYAMRSSRVCQELEEERRVQI